MGVDVLDFPPHLNPPPPWGEEVIFSLNWGITLKCSAHLVLKLMAARPVAHLSLSSRTSDIASLGHSPYANATSYEGLPVCNGYAIPLDGLERAGILTGSAYYAEYPVHLCYITR